MNIRMGIDIGGTKANMGLLKEDGTIIAQKKLMMVQNLDCKSALALLAKEASLLLASQGCTFSDLSFVGMGVPGTVDASQRIVLNAPNLNWRNEPCAQYVEQICGIKPLLVQDSRAAALGEYLFGAGRGTKLLVCITLGTGIGCGIIVNDTILAGALGTAGEIGHIPVVPEGRLCGCGRFGCVETYGSGTGIARSANEHPSFANQHLTSEAIFELAAQDNIDAKSIIDGAVHYLGQAITAVINTLSPDALVFSGGMCSQTALFVTPLIHYIRTHGYSLAVQDSLAISVAQLGSNAPMIGAAMLDKAL